MSSEKRNSHVDVFKILLIKEETQYLQKVACHKSTPSEHTSYLITKISKL